MEVLELLPQTAPEIAQAARATAMQAGRHAAGIADALPTGLRALEAQPRGRPSEALAQP